MHTGSFFLHNAHSMQMHSTVYNTILCLSVCLSVIWVSVLSKYLKGVSYCSAQRAPSTTSLWNLVRNCKHQLAQVLSTQFDNRKFISPSAHLCLEHDIMQFICNSWDLLFLLIHKTHVYNLPNSFQQWLLKWPTFAASLLRSIEKNIRVTSSGCWRWREVLKCVLGTTRVLIFWHEKKLEKILPKEVTQSRLMKYGGWRY